MKIECYGGMGYEANCYLLTDDEECECYIVDPSVAPLAMERARGRALPRVRAILLTHVHFDHLLALDEWRKTGIPLAVHEADAPALGDPQKNLFGYFLQQNITFAPAEILLHEGDVLPCGKEEIRVLYTPGHALGAVCFAMGDILVTGDTLFAGDIGRTDLYGGHQPTLEASLHRLATLPRDMKVYPGHGPATTLSREKKYNPYMMTE